MIITTISSIRVKPLSFRCASMIISPSTNSGIQKNFTAEIAENF
jgi:hypothetical protein